MDISLFVHEEEPGVWTVVANLGSDFGLWVFASADDPCAPGLFDNYEEAEERCKYLSSLPIDKLREADVEFDNLLRLEDGL